MQSLRKRWPWAAGAAVLAVVLWAAWGVVRSREDAAWQRIQERGVFVVATDASYPPFAAVDANGNLFGFDIDLAEAIGRHWGVSVAFENLTYDALLGSLVVGRNDAVISAFVPQMDRTREVAYTRSYFVGGTVAVVRAEGGPRLSGDPLDWAAGKTLAVEYGASGHALARQWARRVPSVTVVPLNTPAEALLAVESGDADAAIVDALSAYDFMLGHRSVAFAGPPLEPEPYVIAVSAESPQLLAALEDALDALEADGTMEALRIKWFGEAAASP